MEIQYLGCLPDLPGERASLRDALDCPGNISYEDLEQYWETGALIEESDEDLLLRPGPRPGAI